MFSKVRSCCIWSEALKLAFYLILAYFNWLACCAFPIGESSGRTERTNGFVSVLICLKLNITFCVSRIRWCRCTSYGQKTPGRPLLALLGNKYLLKATKLMLTLFRINSIDISMVIMFLLEKKPYMPMKNSAVLTNKICVSGISCILIWRLNFRVRR